jgi:DNA-binding LytR/AlgR family response regulator
MNDFRKHFPVFIPYILQIAFIVQFMLKLYKVVSGVDKDKIMRLAICDDELPMRQQLQKRTETFMAERQIPYTLDTFASAEKLLTSEKIYNIVLMDVRFTGMDGMQAAMALKARCMDTLIIFISSFVQYAPLGYQSTIRYILKSQLDVYFAESLDAAISQIHLQSDTVEVCYGKKSSQIPLSQILYLESANRMIQLHLEADLKEMFPLKCYGKLEEYEMILQKRTFCIATKAT